MQARSPAHDTGDENDKDKIVTNAGKAKGSGKRTTGQGSGHFRQGQKMKVCRLCQLELDVKSFSGTRACCNLCTLGVISQDS